MKIRKGDKVIVIAGKDRGKTGVVVRALPKKDRLVIEGVNIAKRHQRASRARSKGQIVERAMPLHVSNVMVVDPKTSKPSRIAYRVSKDGRERVAQKSGSKM